MICYPQYATDALPSKYFVRAKQILILLLKICPFYSGRNFYEDFNFNFDVKKNDTFFLHDDTVPSTNFTISIEDSKSTEAQKKNVYR
jgi:hypothetical protein